MKSAATIDWLTFTLKMVVDPVAVIKDFLALDPDLFQSQDFGKFGYRKSMYFAGIFVYFDPAEGRKMEMGVCVSMTGVGCRTYEQHTRLTAAGTPLRALIEKIHITDMVHCTRLDLALDDKDKLLDLDRIADCVESGCVNSRIRKRTIYRGYDGSDRSGTTVYIGAPSSDFRIRFYDKAKEKYNPDDERYYLHWVRLEMVMRGKNADGCVAAICNSDDLGLLASAILNDKLAFIERDSDSNISRCQICRWWLDFVDAVAAVKLVEKEDVPHKLERSIDWIRNQVAPSLSLIADARGFFLIREILALGADKRTKQQQALLDDYRNSYHFVQSEDLI